MATTYTRFHQEHLSCDYRIIGAAQSAIRAHLRFYLQPDKVATLVPISTAQLTERFRDIHATRMQGLPFINSKLRVEAVGFQSWEEHELGVLITPWFMNLIVLPEVDADIDQGQKIDAGFPSGNIELTAAQDEKLGLYFSAVLFSSVMDIPNQGTARDIAAEVMRELFDTKRSSKVISRRSIFTATSHADA